MLAPGYEVSLTILSPAVCITIDTVHVPRAEVAKFVELAKAYITSLQGYSKSADCTGIITECVLFAGSYLDDRSLTFLPGVTSLASPSEWSPVPILTRL